MKDFNYVKQLFKDAKDILDSLGIPYSDRINLTVNSRAKSRWGCSKQRFISGHYYYTLEISSMLLGDDVSYLAAMDTMIHELLHCHFKHRGHTGEWKRCAEMVNKAYPQYNIKRCTSAEEKGMTDIRQFKYAITCERCGTVSEYQRYSKIVKLVETQPGRCRCGKCRSAKLKVEVLV